MSDLHMDHGTQLEKSSWDVCTGKLRKSRAVVFGEGYWWGKRIPDLLDAETASPNTN